MWNPYEGGIKYWLYQFYTVYMIMVVLIMRTSTLLVRSFFPNNLTQFLQDFALLAVETSNSAKNIVFLLSRNEILELIEAFNWERYLLCTRQIGEQNFDFKLLCYFYLVFIDETIDSANYRDKTLPDVMKSAKSYTIAMIVASLQYFILYFYTILYGSEFTINDLPIK